MQDRWCYSHAGQTHGPISTAELKRRAAGGLLAADDWLWPAGSDRDSAVPAAAALDFSQLQAGSAPLPNWLGDVERAEQAPPRPTPATTHRPDWLDDIRQCEASPAPFPGTDSQFGVAPVEPAPGQPIPVTLVEVEELAGAELLTKSDAAAVSVPLDWLEDIRRIEMDLLAPGTAPAAVPSPSPPPAAPAASSAQTGLDPDTGRIIDAAQFARWQREQRQQPRGKEIAPVQEVFLKARTALQSWVDAEANKPLILAGNLGAILRHPNLQALLRPYEGYGAVMRDVLSKHLAFLVANRKQFYDALKR